MQLVSQVDANDQEAVSVLGLGVSEEQSSVAEEIARSISYIRDLSNESEQASERSAQASQHLSDLSHDLSSLVGRFRFYSVSAR